MDKQVDFGRIRGNYWPKPDQLKGLFIAPKGHEWTYEGGSDSAGLSISRQFVSEDAPSALHSTDLELILWGNPELGVLLQYSRTAAGTSQIFFSSGDLGKLNQWVRTLHGDLRPVGLYIPFHQAWPPVKEFMDTMGELPKAIKWISSSDLPLGTFPDLLSEAGRTIRAIND